MDKIEGEIADNETKERKDVIKKGIEDFKESLKDPIYVSGSANILWGILFSGDSACGEKSIPESERNRVFDHSHPNFIRDHLKSFERLQVIYNSLRTNVPEKCDRKIYEYLSEIFQKKIINKKVAGDKGELQQWNAMPGCKWERPDKTDMEIRKNISKFYNEWCFEEFNMDSAEERFRDCLKFCELHFYNSRERLKNRIPIVSDEEADVDDYNQMSERYSEWIIKQLSDPDCDRSPDPAGA